MFTEVINQGGSNIIFSDYDLTAFRWPVSWSNLLLIIAQQYGKLMIMVNVSLAAFRSNRQKA